MVPDTVRSSQTGVGATAAAAQDATVATAVAPEATDEEAPKEIFLADYLPPDYKFDTVSLRFELFDDSSLVHSEIAVQPVNQTSHEKPPPLSLHGEQLELVSLKIDGQDVPADAYDVSKRRLVLLSPPSSPFSLSITTRINPKENTALEGLYMSSGNFCTQCEAEGFRRITYFQDRPDVMAKYSTRIEADKSLFPVLLSNGNLEEEGELPGGRHFATWVDPWPKPCYLFALVAGNLKCSQDSFDTRSGRNVTLRIWVQEADLPRTSYAMESLKASMKWDEDVFNLEYDLDLFNIVAVPDFNMGAMENKSLNIFNSRLVLASPATATDGDYSAIEGVIAHEYFHNWTGNRVTCRDWFQLTLKEGLTVFRDQEFSSDMNSRAVQRISDVVTLRTAQFAQDSGAMAHPIRPASYIKMDNFYTVTVYEKGAEVVRMYQTLLGKEGFKKGMDLYFKRHDGQAVTCDDFFAAMADANNQKLAGFKQWLSQAGTPRLSVSSSYDPTHHTFTLTCTQETPSTPGQPDKAPVLIPLSVGLLGSDGHDLPISKIYDGETMYSLPASADSHTVTVSFSKAHQEFTFLDIPERPVPSLLRGFSAPVKLSSDLSRENLLFLLANDSDEFNRWEAAQTIARSEMLRLVSEVHQGSHGGDLGVDAEFLDALGSVLADERLDKAFRACIVSLPSESELADLSDVADPDAIHTVHEFVTASIAQKHKELLLKLIADNTVPADVPYSPDHGSKARRSLRNKCLMYLCALPAEQNPDVSSLLSSAFDSAGNMTDQLAAMAALCRRKGEGVEDERARALGAFYEQWKEDNLVMNKWLSLQASSPLPGNVEAVRALLDHPAFNIKEPNKVYALIGGFANCSVNFHDKDGSGYKFVADMVIQLNSLNAQVASRIVNFFTRWRKFDEGRQALAKAEIERILATPDLSENVYEIAHKCLSF